MLVYLINPYNPLVSIVDIEVSRLNRYRVWKPLGLMVLARLTPPDWEVSIFDENLSTPEYSALPLPDLVGITAFTSQANRAYEVAAHFRRAGVKVVMGGIHATMCLDEAKERVDSVVTGEAEGVWSQVLQDAKNGCLKRCYEGGLAEFSAVPAARHDLSSGKYTFGSIQTTRGCPLNCSFCSVTAFNGAKYRQRPNADVVREFQSIREKYVLVVDDNLVGTHPKHIARAKALFSAMIEANLQKKWIAQVTINFADDEELMALAAKAGCCGVFIGFESPFSEGLREVGKKINLSKGRDFRASVRRIHRHKMIVMGSFIIGLDADKPGIGRRVSEAAKSYGLDCLNLMFLTPLPGTALWKRMTAEKRIALDSFPGDWRYYTLSFPVARYRHFSEEGIIDEMLSGSRDFYSIAGILRRVAACVLHRRKPLVNLVTNLSFRSNMFADSRAYEKFKRRRYGEHGRFESPEETGACWVPSLEYGRRDKRVG
jgi:radical SAM superfamily enzyme YgiQ (UPF0313 family)